jgi:hypothetical protein
MPDRPTTTVKPPVITLTRTCIRCGCPVDEMTPDCPACLMRHTARMKRARARQAGGAEAGDAA